jgi:excisionase family DNA binding protein
MIHMKLLSTSEAASKLGVTERRVRSMITEGKLPAHKLGRDYAIEEQLLKTVPVYGKRGRPSRETVARVSRKLKNAL